MIPAKLYMENFLSHKSSEIDFTQFNSALLIGNTEGDYTKSNGSGKSAIFEGILWCLFNKSRVAMMDDIIKWGEVTCKVSLEFFHGGSTYKVIRSRNRSNSTSNVELKIKDSSGLWKDISGSTSGDTNDKIEQTIKLDYKTFINSVYFRQNDISEFAESEASKKKEILKSIIDISRWDEYERISKLKAKELSSEIKILQSSIQELDESIVSLDSLNLDCSNLEITLKNLKSNKVDILDKLSLLKDKYNEIKKSLDTSMYDKISLEIENLKKDGKVTTSERDSLIKLVDSLNKDLLTEKNKLSLIKDNLSSIVEVPEGIIHELNSQITYHKSCYISSKKELDSIKGHIDCGNAGSCPVCGHVLNEEEYKEFINNQNIKVESLKKDISNSKIEIDSLNSQIDYWNKCIEKNSLIEKKSLQASSIEYKISLLSDEILKNQSKIDDLTFKVNVIKSNLASNKLLLESIKNNDFQEIKDKIKSLEADLSSLDTSISEKENLSGRLHERISILKDKIKNLQDKRVILHEKINKVSILEKLSKLLGKSGIQTVLLDSIIEDLEKSSNGILQSICNEPATIILETQRVGSDGVSMVETLDLKVLKDGNLHNFKSLSGGEKFRISLALRVGMSELSSRYGGSSLEFLMLDEVNSPLDRYGVETLFVNVIKSLESKYKILTITHDESLKEKFDNVINVTKINGESEVEFTVR